MSGKSPPFYCTLTLIAMQGHQTKQEQCSTYFKRVVIIIIYENSAIEPYIYRGIIVYKRKER